LAVEQWQNFTDAKDRELGGFAAKSFV